MRKDLEICVADFKELMDKLDWAIADKTLTPLLVVAYVISIEEIADRIRTIATGAFNDQEERGDTPCNQT